MRLETDEPRDKFCTSGRGFSAFGDCKIKIFIVEEISIDIYTKLINVFKYYIIKNNATELQYVITWKTKLNF